MKNYKDSDYALNKYSAGIVYRFGNQIMEITLADYLAANPDSTEQDFQKWKALSDSIYLDQVRAENAQTKKNDSIHGMEESRNLGGIPLDEEYIETQERETAKNALSMLLKSGMLTETQERRFRMHIFDGLSIREIARREGVVPNAIEQSVSSAVDKLKKHFNFF